MDSVCKHKHRSQGLVGAVPSWAEVHFILAISLEKTIVFPKDSCSLICLDNSSLGQHISDSGRKPAVP